MKLRWTMSNTKVLQLSNHILRESQGKVTPHSSKTSHSCWKKKMDFGIVFQTIFKVHNTESVTFDSNYPNTRETSPSWVVLISPQGIFICQASAPPQLMDPYFIALILPLKPAPLSKPPTSPLHSYGLDEIQTLCGSILKWPNSVCRGAKWKVVKSFEPLLHYSSSKHIQLGPKFSEDIKAPSHVSLEDDNRWAPLKLLRQSTIKGPRGRTPCPSDWLLMACVCRRQLIVISSVTHTSCVGCWRLNSINSGLIKIQKT